jgi:penicillin amidase
VLSRDDAGLMRVVAATQRDAFFGQGYAHAADRLWEIEFSRLAAQGRLSEFVGSAALDVDKGSRTFNFRHWAEDMCAAMQPAERALLQAYVDGLNHYLATQSARPIEFSFMLGGPTASIVPGMRLFSKYEPEPFDINLPCYVGKLLQYQLASGARDEANLFSMWWSRPDLSYADAFSFADNYTNVSHTILSAEQLNITAADADAARTRMWQADAAEGEIYAQYFDPMRQQQVQARSGLPNSDDAASAQTNGRRQVRSRSIASLQYTRASNAWAARDSNGTSAGASDPHLTLNLPSVWYYVHMEYANFTTTGVGLPGIPGVHVGRTTHMFWGITMAQTDSFDLFALQMVNTTHYTLPDDAGAPVLPLTVRREVIKVQGEDDYVLEAEDSVAGPVVNFVYFDHIKSIPFKFVAVSALLQPDNTTIGSILGLSDPTVTTVLEQRERVWSQMRAPVFSIPSADNYGNVAWSMTGTHFQRAPNHTGGWPSVLRGANPYVTEIAYYELPSFHSPAGTNSPVSISCANQRPYPDGYKYDLGRTNYDWGYRGQRVQELLAATSPSELASVSRHTVIQSDVHSSYWLYGIMPQLQRVVPQLLELLKEQARPGNANAQQWLVGQDGFGLDATATPWSGRTTVGDPTSTFFWRWMQQFSAVLRDVSPDDVLGVPLRSFEYMLSDAPPAFPLSQCASFLTKRGVSTATNTTLHACWGVAAYTLAAVAKRYPTTSAVGLKWGVDVKPVLLEHLMMSETPLACMFDREVRKSGDVTTIDVSDFDLYNDMFETKAASSVRQVYSAQTLDVTMAYPGGANGNPYSALYANLLPAWANDIYRVVIG